MIDMSEQPNGQEAFEARKVSERLTALQGRSLTVDGAQIGMPDHDTVEVEVSGVIWYNKDGVDADGTQYVLNVIPSSWKEAEPDRKFGSEALSLELENPEEFLREHEA